MPLTDLLESLDARAAAELNQVTAAQQAQADDLREAAVRDAEQLHQQTVRDAAAQAETEAASQLAELTSRLRHREDEAVHHELDQLWADVWTRLQALPGTAEGHAATGTLLREALQLLPEATTVRVHAAHAEAAHQVVADRPGRPPAIVADLDHLGAVVSDDHSHRVVNTVPERLTAVWPALRTGAATSWRRSP